jgi:hypothetical protein
MSIFSCDVFNSFKMSDSNQAFNFKYQASAASAAVNAKTAEKSVKKKLLQQKLKILHIICSLQLIISCLL